MKRRKRIIIIGAAPSPLTMCDDFCAVLALMNVNEAIRRGDLPPGTSAAYLRARIVALDLCASDKIYVAQDDKLSGTRIIWERRR